MTRFLHRRLVFANRKGGCGKTTTAVNVAHALAERGRRVLLLDADPQAHATLSLGIGPHQSAPNMSHVMRGEAALSEAVRETPWPGLSIAPSDRDLMAFEIEGPNAPGAETRLAMHVHEAVGRYDYLIMDPPPTVGLLTVSALAAAGEVFIPMPMHFLAMEGLAEMMRLIYTVNANWNRNLAMKGVIPTFYNRNTRIAREIAGEIVENFGEDRLLPGIRMNVSLAEAPGHGKPVAAYAPKSAGAEDYAALAARIDEAAP